VGFLDAGQNFWRRPIIREVITIRTTVVPRRLAATALAVAAGLTFAATAHAESATLETDGMMAPQGINHTTKGYALTTFTVLFPSKKTFSISGVVRDVCPEDGYGAYVKMDYYVNGPAGGEFAGSRTIGKDTNGCGTSSEQFSVGSDRKLPNLDGVRVSVCEIDADSDHHNDTCTFPKSFDNPLR
jgi:hypothetical protein